MLSVQDCDVSSTTGSGIASEGGRIDVGGSRIHDCHSHGIAVFSDLDGRAGHLAVLNFEDLNCTVCMQTKISREYQSWFSSSEACIPSDTDPSCLAASKSQAMMFE